MYNFRTENYASRKFFSSFVFASSHYLDSYQLSAFKCGWIYCMCVRVWKAFRSSRSVFQRLAYWKSCPNRRLLRFPISHENWMHQMKRKKYSIRRILKTVQWQTNRIRVENMNELCVSDASAGAKMCNTFEFTLSQLILRIHFLQFANLSNWFPPIITGPLGCKCMWVRAAWAAANEETVIITVKSA